MQISARQLITAVSALLAVLALSACGSSSKSSSSSSSSSSSASSTSAQGAATYQALSAATAQYNQALAVFNKRFPADAKAGNLSAAKADTAALRTALFNYDASVRKISFPPQYSADVNSLLQEDGTIINDLDAAGAAKNSDEFNRLFGREHSDSAGLVAAANKLLHELPRS